MISVNTGLGVAAVLLLWVKEINFLIFQLIVQMEKILRASWRLTIRFTDSQLVEMLVVRIFCRFHCPDPVREQLLSQVWGGKEWSAQWELTPPVRSIIKWALSDRYKWNSGWLCIQLKLHYENKFQLKYFSNVSMRKSIL